MSYDSTSVKANELLSYFGRNTAIEVQHKYGATECAVVSTRTKNVIAIVDVEIHRNLEFVANEIMMMKKFPKNRKQNRAWSPIRLTERAKADNEISRATMAWYTS